MNRRSSLRLVFVALVFVVLHALLVRWMAHGHVAHVLLGAGNAAPPLGAALLAVALVVVRVVAVVVVPGALLAALASLIAHVLLGPPRGGAGHGDEEGDPAGASSGTSSGTSKRSPASTSIHDASDGGDAGTSMEGRAT